MINKENRRTKMTKALIRSSFVELMQKQSLHKITIKDICDNADVNRSTFYSYYSDQYALLDEIKNDIFENLKEIIKGSSSDYKGKATDLLEMLFRYIADNVQVCKLLMNDQKDFDFLQKVWDFILTNFTNEFIINKDGDQRTTEYIYLFAISGCMGLIHSWMEHGLDKTPAQMAEMMMKLIGNGFHAYGWEPGKVNKAVVL